MLTYLDALITRAVHGSGLATGTHRVAPTKKNAADYQWNGAFAIAKASGMDAKHVAGLVGAALEATGDHILGKVECVGPFVNIWVSNDWLWRLVCKADLRPPQVPHGTVVIDYSSPNLAKQMHVGHLRSTIIGDSIARLLRATGRNVHADNHVGDWGTPFGKLIVAWRLWGDNNAFFRNPVEELQRLYERFNKEAETDPTMDDAARHVTVLLQAGTGDPKQLWQRFTEASQCANDVIYDRLHVVFNETRGEAMYAGRLRPLVEELLARGVAVESDGAAVIRLDPPLDEPPFMIRKRDGGYLYATTDIATIEHRVKEHGEDAEIIYVTDVRQKQHFAQLFASVDKIGIRHGRLRHVYFGMLRLPSGDLFKSREGKVIALGDLLDEAVVRARAAIGPKSAHLSESEREHIAEAVGIGAVKYADLSRDPTSDITFDWNRMLAFDGNTAPYLMYAHARCCGIIAKAAGWPVVMSGKRLESASERDLALAVCRTPDVVSTAAEALRPHLLCEHLHGIAARLGRFLDEHRVIQADSVSSEGLALVSATAAALRQGLDLLGIEPLTRM